MDLNKFFKTYFSKASIFDKVWLAFKVIAPLVSLLVGGIRSIISFLSFISNFLKSAKF